MSMKVEQWQWSDAGGWDARPFSGTLGASAQLVLVFGGAKLVSAQECVAKAHRAFPNARVFGCSTGGEIHGHGSSRWDAGDHGDHVRSQPCGHRAGAH